MIVLNTRTGETRTIETSDPREAVALAWLQDHDRLTPIHHSFLPLKASTGRLSYALGDWFAFSVPNPVLTLARWERLRRQGARDAFNIANGNRRQRRGARRGYLRRAKVRKVIALESVFDFNTRGSR